MGENRYGKLDAEVLDQRVHRGKDGAEYVALMRLKRELLSCEHVVRVEVRSDPYPFQCYARASRWDGSQWQHVVDLGHSNMATKAGMKSDLGKASDFFTAVTKDREELVALCDKIFD